ncbi:DMT family transporter [Oryzifoliimicrobium ureilyticus]|uniref:DMT family transporter n=1 Tax=Oryzifoliimicrobium ureilyticus TaxID=3113724 RepID=UPI00307663B5
MSLSRNTQGSLYMCMAMAGFSCGDALSKSVVQTINAGELIFVRGLFISIFVWILAWRLGALKDWRKLFSMPVLVRVLGEGAAAVTYITALGLMPIANASAIFQVLPLMITLGAALFFNEPVGWKRWTAIFVGLTGVLIIIRPGTDGFTLGALLCVLGVLATTARDLATRKVDPSVPSLAVTAVNAPIVAIFGAAFTPVLGEWKPIPLADIVQLLAAALVVFAGYQCSIMAMRHGEISFVAPFRYTSLIFSATFGLIFFSEVPDHWAVVGAAIVVASGIYTFYREAKRRVEPLASTSPLGTGTSI